MARTSSRTSRPLLAYSTNVHRGETLADVYRFLRDYTLPVKRRVFGAEPAGLELRLGIGSARELRRPAALEAFRGFLSESGLVPFSINAYPLRDFHARRVKEQVYLPSWTDAARAAWTNRIAAIHAAILPEGLAGSVSTLGGCFRGAAHGPAAFRRIAANYLSTVEALARIEEETGKTIVLAVEPEPDTTFETARDVVEFFEGWLLPAARERWRPRGLGPVRTEERLRRLFTVNYDTCHLSVLFQDTVEGLRELWRAGIEVGKVHVTSAVAVRDPYRAPEAYRELRGMDEPRYFHQFCGRDAAGQAVWRGLDLRELPEKLVRGRHPDVVELRSHYHVPLYLIRWRRLRTTREETRAAVLEVLRARRCSHLVVETYTWPILATEDKLVAGIARELEWLLGVIRERDGLKSPRATPRAR
ncbi:MAG: metabolite traffic protein EboE [Planctomycetes bacterium]|nr:metabolite traffic protein EboE [Planctomycetota bacterium]